MTTIAIMADRLVAADSEYVAQLVALRIEKHLEVTTIAERMGVSVAHVHRFESYWHDPTLAELRRYALALGVLVAHIVTEVDITQAQAGEVWDVDYAPDLLRRTGFLNQGGEHEVYEANGGQLFLRRLEPDGARGHIRIDSANIISATRVNFSTTEKSS